MLDSPSHAYRLGIMPKGAIEAFAILRGLGDVHANLYLKRVAVARPGQGLGTTFLSLVLDEAFGPMGAERFYLDCFADNARAQRVYRKLGMSRDGVLRQAYRLGDGDPHRPNHDGGPEERVAGATVSDQGSRVRAAMARNGRVNRNRRPPASPAGPAIQYSRIRL